MTDKNKELTAAQMLFEARTSGRRKREISTIAKVLCIREEYLAALETGKYHVIPETVYILGFARNYAMELGLDPNEVVYKIKQELGLIDESEEDEEESESEEAAEIPEKKVEKKSKPNKDLMAALSKYLYKNWKWLVAVVAAVVVVAGLTIFLVSLGSGSGNSEVVETSANLVKEPNYKQAVRETFGSENRANSTVFIQAVQESWVKIEDARGNTVFSRVLVPGDVYYVPSGSFKGTFGNAGGLDVWVNGNLIPKLGAPNVRKSNVLMTPESLVPSENTETE